MGTCRGTGILPTMGCRECGGSGKRICPCWSNMFEKCNHCDYQRYRSCTNCHGTGNARITCSTCRGRGY